MVRAAPRDVVPVQPFRSDSSLSRIAVVTLFGPGAAGVSQMDPEFRRQNTWCPDTAVLVQPVMVDLTGPNQATWTTWKCAK